MMIKKGGEMYPHFDRFGRIANLSWRRRPTSGGANGISW